MTGWWQARASGEQRTMLLVAACAIPLLYWTLFWDPLAQSRAQLRSQAAEQQATALWLQQIMSLAASSDDAGRVGLPAGKSLLRLVDETLRAQGLAAAIERIEPGQSEQEVRIWLRNVSFDQLINWLSAMVGEYGLVGNQLSINQSNQQGTGLVNARIDLLSP